MKKYYSAICLIIRDENDYLQEWVRWHIALGFEHIYIYDHNCKVPIEETVKKKLKKSERDYVTVIDWSGRHKHAQDEAYDHCLATFRNSCEWIAFIDTDEFIVLHQDDNINSFLKRYEQPNVGGIYMNWIMYNANGLENWDRSKGVMERFTQTCPDPQQYGKVIQRTDFCRKPMIHMGIYFNPENIHTVDENGEIVVGKRHPYHTDFIQCNHYYTKSWEEWKLKISRGVADPYFGRDLQDFFMHNPDMKYLDDGINYTQEYERGVL